MRYYFSFLFCLFIGCDDTISTKTLDCNDIYNNLELQNFNLQDLNPNSNSFSNNLNPQSFPGMIRLFYFSNNEN